MERKPKLQNADISHYFFQVITQNFVKTIRQSSFGCIDLEWRHNSIRETIDFIFINNEESAFFVSVYRELGKVECFVQHLRNVIFFGDYCIIEVQEVKSKWLCV